MENNEFSLPEYSAKPQFRQTAATERDWKTIGVWSKFFGIYGYVSLVAGLLGFGYVAYSISNLLAGNPLVLEFLPTRYYFLLGIMLIMLVVSFICAFLGSRYHLRFSEKIKLALERRDQDILTDAWSDMRLTWKTYGINLITTVVSYMLMLIMEG